MALTLGVYSTLFYGNNLSIENITQEAKVIKVIDGDTIEIEGGNQVRYIGIDTPEIGSYYADEATNRNRQLVEGKSIKVERDILSMDKYQRILGYVYVGDIMVNEDLLKNGYANILIIEPDVKYRDKLSKAFDSAKINKVGLWKTKQ